MSQSRVEYGHSFRGKASATDLMDWLALFFAESQAVFYSQHSLKRGKHGVSIVATLPTDFVLSDWEQGRVFNSEFELRWHVQGEKVNLLLLAEQQTSIAACEALCTWQPSGTDYEVASTRHMLVGTFYRRQDGEWFFAQASVPCLFHYPVDVTRLTTRDRAHAILHGKYYRHGGGIQLTRFTHFSVERVHGEGGERR